MARPLQNIRTAAFATLLLLAAAGSAVAQQEKLAQTGMKFLSVSVDPRAVAMGSAHTAVEGESSMLFYNPAAMAWQRDGFSVALSHTGWIADVNYEAASLSFKPGSGGMGVFGLSFVFVDYGTLQETIRFDNDDGFIDLGTFSPQSWSLGGGYARALNDRFSVGGQIKYAKQDLGSSVVGVVGEGEYTRTTNSEGVVAFDFGMFYKTGFKSLNFAVSARNFAQEITYAEESFQLPLTLRIGLAMDVMDLMGSRPGSQSLLVTVDAENPRDFSEQVNLGVEYLFANTLALRAGYRFPTDQEGVSLGVGLKQALGNVGFGADYSFTSFGVFSSIHRLAVKFAL